MPKNLTDVDNFDTNVICPVSADARTAASVESGLQNLANRTKYVKNRLDPLLVYADYHVSGTSIATSASFPVTLKEGGTGFSVVGNEVQVPTAGVYEISAFWGGFNADTGINPRCIIEVRPTQFQNNLTMVGCRPGTSAGDIVGMAGSRIITITTPASERIGLYNMSTGALTVQLPNAGYSRLTIKRLA